MPIRNSKVLTWRPSGVTDTRDSTNTGLGAMSALTNLIPDPSTKAAFVPRPASIQLGGISTVYGAVSVFLILGDMLYGMISAGAYDTPFIYNLLTNEFSLPAGITASNLPATQSLVGGWTPPTMATIGAYVLVTHPGFTGPANGYFGWFDLTTPSAPVWQSGNTAVNPLVGVATSVAIFGGRAYYAVGNATQASDPYAPLTQTNAGQTLTYGDSSPITALAGLPLNNTTGGIIQALMVFKGVSNIFQVTGDYTGTPSVWAINTLNLATGTLSPNSICPTPAGLAFVAPDGVRVIDFFSNIGPPIGSFGEGIVVPFQNAANPSRMVAAYNMQTLRIAVQQQATSLQSTVEYWFNFGLKAWTGPHSLPTTFLAPYKNSFIAAFVPDSAV